MKLIISYVVDLKCDGLQPGVIEAVERCLVAPRAFQDAPETDSVSLMCNSEGRVMVGDVLGEISEPDYASPESLALRLAELMKLATEADKPGSPQKKKLERTSARLPQFTPSEGHVDMSISEEPTKDAAGKMMLMKAAGMLKAHLDAKLH